MTSSERLIENLIARYAFLVDDGDFAGLGELFADADFALGSNAVHGAEAVAELAGRVLRTYDDGTPRTRHVTTNIVLDVDEEAGTAQARAYFTVFQQVDDLALQPIATGRYRDVFARRDGVWCFTSRVVDEQFYGDVSHHVKPTSGAGLGLGRTGTALAVGQ